MRHLTAAIVVVAMAWPLGADADKPDHKSKDKGTKHHEDVQVVIGVHERDVVRTYFVETHGRGHCPPGLAKKDNGCLPPGQARKRYVVGQPLPPAVVVVEVPVVLSQRLGPPPTGYRYGIVDGDLVKLVVGTALVVDAIQGLVD
jgi:hypothetical protein